MNQPPKLYRDPADETWRIFRIMAEFVDGFELLSSVGAAISVFGSARTPRSHPLYAQAEQLGRRLAEAGFAVITGGGPGLMEAVNKGAFEAGGVSVGLNITLPVEQAANAFQTHRMEFKYFFCRKVMFVKYCVGLVCLPGGYGTLDEFFETLTLIQTGKAARYPIVLIGADYWQPFARLLREQLVERYATVSPADLDLFIITDDLDQAVAHIRARVSQDLPQLRHPTTAEEAAIPEPERISAEGTRVGQPAMRPAAPAAGSGS